MFSLVNTPTDSNSCLRERYLSKVNATLIGGMATNFEYSLESISATLGAVISSKGNMRIMVYSNDR